MVSRRCACPTLRIADFGQMLVSLAPPGGVQIAKQSVVVLFHTGKKLRSQDNLIDCAVQQRRQLPAPSGPVKTCRQQCLAVGAEGDVADGASMDKRWAKPLS